jgi:hypothetical protein
MTYPHVEWKGDPQPSVRNKIYKSKKKSKAIPVIGRGGL